VDDVYLGVGEEVLEVGCAAFRRAGNEVVAAVDPGSELDAVALRLPPLDSAEEIGSILPRARGRGDADGPAVGKSAGEEGGRFQNVNLTSARSTLRRWVEGGFAFAAIAACVAAASVGAGPARAAPPNVLLIVTDDQRQGSMQVMPNTRHYFFDKGRSFPRGFVTTPNCCPSRASIFTGLFAHNHGVRTNGSANLPQNVTMQRYLHDAGYKTAILGKYLNSWPLADEPPYFDHWALIKPDSYQDALFNIDGTVAPVPGYSTDVIGSQTIDFLRAFDQEDAKPWFIYVAPVAPHRPAIPAERCAAAAVPAWRPSPAVLEADRSDKPPWIRHQAVSLAKVRTERANMLRTLMSVDDIVAEIFRELRVLDETRNTLAIFISDNGYEWGEHRLRGKWRRSTSPSR